MALGSWGTQEDPPLFPLGSFAMPHVISQLLRICCSMPGTSHDDYNVLAVGCAKPGWINALPKNSSDNY